MLKSLHQFLHYILIFIYGPWKGNGTAWYNYIYAHVCLQTELELIDVAFLQALAHSSDSQSFVVTGYFLPGEICEIFTHRQAKIFC